MAYRYYSTQRPIGIGCFPKTAPVKDIHNFFGRIFVDSINRPAWGYIDYEEKIQESDAADYELVEFGYVDDEMEVSNAH